MDRSERIAEQERRGVLTQHRDRMANDPEYREAALTAPSITDKTGISAKTLPRTEPTALSSSDASAPDFDVDTAKVPELQDEVDRLGLEVEGTGKDGKVVKDDLVGALKAHRGE